MDLLSGRSRMLSIVASTIMNLKSMSWSRSSKEMLFGTARVISISGKDQLSLHRRSKTNRHWVPSDVEPVAWHCMPYV